MLKRFVLFVTMTLCLVPLPAVADNATKVLFIGSDYVSHNDLPGMLEQLAAADDRLIMTGQSTVKGFRLKQHLYLKQTNLMIDQQNWDYVIIQEHGVLPLEKERREMSMYPAVKRFNKAVARRGGQTVLFLTWGRPKGLKKTRFKNFGQMQSELNKGYQDAAADELMIAPVGEAFHQALDNDEGISLLFKGRSTPTLAGSYLAACVVYATLFQKSPFGLEYTGGLPPAQARYLQDLAGEVVFKQHKRWNIPSPRKSQPKK